MIDQAESFRRPRRLLTVLTVWLGALGAAQAAVPGFVEDFTSGIGGFHSGSQLSHVPSGGVGGPADGYLSVVETIPGHLGAATSGLEFTGNLLADGVTGFSFWLRDIGGDDELEMHVGLGNAFFNFWLYRPGFAPPEDAWAEFTVDFTHPADWVRIRGSGTFQEALMTSDRLLFRHDLAPFMSNPDPMVGDFALDRVRVLPEPSSLWLVAIIGAVGAHSNASIRRLRRFRRLTE